MATDGTVAAAGLRGKLTIRQLLAELTIPELWGAGAALITLVGGAFGLGVLYRGHQADLARDQNQIELTQAKLDAQTRVSELQAEWQGKERRTGEEIGALKGEVARLRTDQQFDKVKGKFLDLGYRYYRTSTAARNPRPGLDLAQLRADATTARLEFTRFFKSLRDRGEDLEKNGFVVSTGDSPTEECDINFYDRSHYRVPFDVKQGAIVDR